MPQDLYDKLKKSADSSRRSLTQESIVLLEEALALMDSGLDRERRKKVLDEIATNRKLSKKEAELAIEWIRNDRDSR